MRTLVHHSRANASTRSAGILSVLARTPRTFPSCAIQVFREIVRQFAGRQPSQGNDDLKGKDGNDTFDGGAGNDKIDGGKGIDTAIYHGNYSDFVVAISKNGDATVAGNTAPTIAANGTDTLKNVEFLKFADATVDVQNDVTHRSDASIGGNEIQGAGQPHPGDPWWGGGGNSLLHYNIADLNAQDVELGLKFHYRGGADITPGAVDNDGTVHYTANHGNQDATHSLVNFDYVVNTGLDGNTDTLASFDFKMIVEQTQGSTTKTAVFDLNPANHVWTLEGNPAVGFGGDDFRTGTTPDLMTVSQVSENSENFAFIQGAFPGQTLSQMTSAGTEYSITLEAIDHGHIIGSSHDVLLLV
jgi:hypothetical protein